MQNDGMPGQGRSRLLLALGLTAVLLAPVPSAQAAQTAQAAERAPDRSVVTSGSARFQVLSPTLIRTEFAGDAKFVDAGTFNVVGRTKFTSPRFTTRTGNGWLTIDTGEMTLRYRTGSGAFAADNLQVRLTAGRQSVQAAPWAGQGAVACAFATLCEAEALSLDGLARATDHSGYTGGGFAAGYEAPGSSLRFSVNAPSSGTFQLAVRYANDRGGDGQVTGRTLRAVVDGDAGQQFALAPTGSWDTWAVVNVPVTLSAGRHEVTIVRGPAESGQVNVDSLALTETGAAYPAPSVPIPQPCSFGTVCEADTGVLAGGAKIADDHNGYSGKGFVAGMERAESSDTITVNGVPKAGKYQLQLRYANAKAGSQPVQTRTVAVQVGSATASTLDLKATSGWDHWRTVTAPVTLAAGTNTVKLGCPAEDSCHVNIDTVALTTTGETLLVPHAPLGGYRRGLDGVNGDAKSTPGLLYQDGWSLLDDTASALWNPATKKVTQRASHAGGYQDGYVFGYGQDYSTGLSDLSKLTGPTLTLPKWAYGVWYAEYYDRTAAQFQEIVRRFQKEKVPLDVLVVDTDFKKPDRWNGWSIDETRFPDPKGFNDWLHAQGLHTTWNIHPSILGSDPKFAAAQATAKGKLKRTGCNGGADCYSFDWGDPDQLAAYLDLHDDIEKQGVDFWWLDWCCDASSSSLAGVTPDAWINQQYAERNGFAFSRAYGSLQAGGYSNPASVATGPWADKRTTLHFTGDTLSTWETLQAQVGYTPGESAATGLAAISHDIGGHTGGLQEPGSEPGSTKLPDDLYARWVQLGTFQPIDRLHSNHSDRLPWQYGPAAQASAEKFLKLRKKLQPYTYAAAQEATRTGTPIVRPLYLAYPGEQEAYASAGSEYLYGPDLLVAPVTTAGTSATTSVWFPPGSTWKDYFTGKKYKGGSTAQITTGLDTMPVFVKS
ncbi:TIM-barrel domain-containing protein [Kineosporia sp. NBRC 101731]|uniref:TIM-barrel domain-containing protein n=1 Tax=Kineosporia sp. NBRC 101731 TaxID=3032199 RepID=UPI00249FFA66|nr:TIM-barrel domain-containing protein [Kineosporia sp. NBRC 101731]GLY28661.1 alpha-xylosidase [Kineosporia sp. NBRC 101731]